MLEKQKLQANFQWCIDSTLSGFIVVGPGHNSRLKISRPHFRKDISMPLTELILTENVPGLGAEADLVKVRRGYARNYLLPRKMAHEVTPAALRKLDALRQKRAEREARELNEAQEL